MLQTIREYTQGWIAGTIISIIILSFALWGIHSYFTGSGASNAVAVVNGVDITKEQFAVAYDRLRRQVQAQYGVDALKNETLLKDRALKDLVEFEVLKQASLKQGFGIFNNQIDNYLQNVPAFQINGQFSVERFQQVLTNASLSMSDFIDLVRSNLLVDQPRLGITLTSFALPDETSYTASLVNQERDIQYITIPTQYFLAKVTAIAADKIKAYYDQHQSEFMTPEQVSVDYLQLSTKDATSEKYSQLREQLANLTYERPDNLQDAAKKLGLTIQTSEMFTKDKGGQGISQLQKVRDIAFSNDVLNLQNNSDVIQINPETVIVLRIKSHITPALLPLKDVSSQIENKLKAQEANQQADKFAQDFVAKLNAGTDPAQLATTYQFNWIQAGLIARYATKIDSAILDLAFRLSNPALHSNKIAYGYTKFPSGYAIVALKSVKSGTIADEKQNTVFAEQVQNSEGALEYMLYKRSQLLSAKIKRAS